jgi:hypothetical protein
MKGSLPISLGVKHRGHPLGLKIENRAYIILESRKPFNLCRYLDPKVLLHRTNEFV